MRSDSIEYLGTSPVRLTQVPPVIRERLEAGERDVIINEIRRLLELEDAVIVAHYYTDPEIQALADDGIVEISDTRRSFVADITETHAEETFDILAMLEPYSAGLAADRATDEDVAELRTLIDKMEIVIDDDIAFLDLNSQFHRKIHRLSGNRGLREIIERVVDFPTTLYLKLGQSTESSGANDDHRRILAALERRDCELAALEMKAHVEYRRREFREQWLEYDGD